MNKAAVQWQVILGRVPAKSNMYRIGNKRFYKSKEVKEYEDSFNYQCNLYRHQRIEGKFELYLKVYFKNNRSDLDNSTKVILDNLQRMGIIENDRNCVKIDAEKYHDAVNPRIEFFLNELT
jgi:Holliday junction resolvase RusA-like endonuclease